MKKNRSFHYKGNPEQVMAEFFKTKLKNLILGLFGGVFSI